MIYSLFLQLPGTTQGPVNITSPVTKFNTLGDIISGFLPYLFAISGIILLVAILWSGFSLALSGGSPDKVKSAKGCLTSAFIGFLIIIAAYWIIQILEVILKIQIF